MTHEGSRPVPGRMFRTARMSRIGAIGAMVAAFALIGALPAHATHFRYGTINWVPAASPPRTIIFQVQDAFRRAPTVNESSLDPCIDITTLAVTTCTGIGSGDGHPGVGDVVREDIGGTQFFFGDGSHIPSGNTPMFYQVTSIDMANNWMFVQGLDPSTFGTAGAVIDPMIAHTYTGNTATFTAGLDDCCRISGTDPPNGHINNPDFGYRVQTIVNVGGTFAGNSSPVSNEIPIVNCPISTDAPCPPGVGQTCTFTVPGVDPDGDPLFFRMATSSEAFNGLVNSSNSPGSVFHQPGPPNSTFSASIDSSTGVYTWNTCGATLASSGLNTLYSTQVIIEDRLPDGVTVKSHIPVDFLIQLVPLVNNPPQFDHPPTPVCGSTQTVLAGNNVSFTVQATDPDVGDIVTLNVAGLPTGATMNPTLPTTGNPVSSVLSWTPTAAQVGTYVVNFSATDQSQQQVTCPVTIEVDCNVALCDDGNECTDDSCTAPLGVCQNTNKPDSTPCTDTDGNACTTAGCEAGACVQTHVTTTCDPSANPCQTNPVCDPADGICKGSNKPDSTPCTDTDGNLCTTAGCEAGACVQTHIQTVCNPSTNECVNDAVCDPADGTCKSTTKPDSTPCTDTDGKTCTTAGCEAGTCVQTHIVNNCTLCGNGKIDPGETCDPPGSLVAPHAGGTADRICRNDCTYCGDGIVNDSETCDDGDATDGRCAPPVNNCRNDCTIEICGDPADIKFHNAPQLDFLNVFGRIIPESPFDPASVPVSFTLADEQGTVRLSESLQIGQFKKTGQSWKFNSLTAKTKGGIKSWTISPHNLGYSFRIQAYGSFRNMTSLMKGTLSVGTAKFTVDGKWLQKPTGWVLLLKNATPH